MPENLKHKIGQWHSLVGNLTAHLHELPNLAEDHAELAALLVEANELEAEQKLCEAKLREVNRRRYDLAARGRSLRNRLAVGLQSAYGLESERLIEFGVKPRPRVIRRERLTQAQRARREAAAAAPTAQGAGGMEGLESPELGADGPRPAQTV
jgi:hypothetical protein